jgi:hypothetical protein
LRDGGLRTQILGCVQILLVAYNNQRLRTKITFGAVHNLSCRPPVSNVKIKCTSIFSTGAHDEVGGNLATARVAVPVIQLFANHIGTYQDIVP